MLSADPERPERHGRLSTSELVHRGDVVALHRVWRSQRSPVCGGASAASTILGTCKPQSFTCNVPKPGFSTGFPLLGVYPSRPLGEQLGQSVRQLHRLCRRDGGCVPQRTRSRAGFDSSRPLHAGVRPRAVRDALSPARPAREYSAPLITPPPLGGKVYSAPESRHAAHTAQRVDPGPRLPQRLAQRAR